MFLNFRRKTNCYFVRATKKNVEKLVLMQVKTV